MPIQVPVTQVGLEASIQAAAQKAGRNLKLDLGVSSRAISGLSQPLGKITGQADQFTKSMEAANARVLAFGASVGVLAAVGKGFTQIVTTTIEVEKSLANINTILGANAAQLGKFKNDIFSVARETGNSFQTVSEAALELSRQGLKTDEVLRRLKDSMILSRLSGLDAASSVEGLTAAVNSFSKEGLTTSQVLNKISKTAAGFAVSERDLIEGFKRSASVAQQAGVSIDELGGIITAVQQKTARGGAVIGNSFKTIFTRIQRPSSLQLLQDIGADVTNAEGKLLTGTQLLGNLAEKLDSLNEIQLASITEKIGGGFQIAPLIAALDDLNSKTSIYKEATETMASASGEAYARNAVLNQTMAAAINTATVNLKELANTLGEIGVTDSLKNILSFFNSFAENVKDVLQGEGLGSDMAKGIIKGISAVISGPGLLIFGAIIAKLTINFAQFGVQALKTFFNIGAAAREIGSIQTTIASTLLNNKAIQTQILALEGNRAAQAQFFSTALNTQLATMEKMRSIAASIAPVVYGATTGSRKPKAAEGYMPTVMAEAGDIKKGVGGARSSDRPVVIPNFAFGGGKTGTMVAHTGEYIVPNFASGGSAIFNRDMVKSMGLPEGARKIGAAGGFIPNFVSSIKDAKTEKQFDALYSQPRYAKNAESDAINFRGTTRGIAAAKAVEAALSKTSTKQVGTLQLNAKDFGGLGLVSVSGATAGVATAKAKLSETEKGIIDRYAGKNTSFTHASIDGVSTRSLTALSKDQKDNQKAFRQKTRDIFVDPLFKLAEALMPGVFVGNDEAQRKAHLTQKGSDPYIFSDSVLGGIFESAVSVSTKAIKNMGAFDAANQTSPFDFEEAGGATAPFLKAFGFPENTPMFKAEAKKTQRSDSLGSIVGKAIRDADLRPKVANAVVKAKAAGGYIPNFADPLQDAVVREMSAGVPASQIYIDQNSSLKGPMNPTGLMVANRRDEPAGGFQGINRARKEGADARMYGAAGGFVPNYAAPIMGSLNNKQKSTPSGSKLEAALQSFATELKEGKITIEKVISELGKLAPQATKMTSSAQALAKKYAEEISVRNQSHASKILESKANKKLAAQLDKIYLEYNKSEKTARDLQKAQTKAAAVLNRSSLRPATQSAIASSTVSLAGSRQSAQPTEKGPRDMLGTIFAVQAGLSLLGGATSDATSGLGKFANSLSSVASTATSVLFIGQGLSGIAKQGSTASAALGKIGIYGAIAAGVFEGFKQVGSYLDSTNLSINKASGAMEKVAKAAENASVSLGKFRPSEVKEIQKQREALIFGARTSGVSKSTYSTYGGMGGGMMVDTAAVAEFEGFTDEMQTEFEAMVDTALGAGVSYGKIWKMINESSKTGALITAEEVAKISKEIEGLTEIAAKFKPDDVIKKFKLSPEEGLGQKLISATPERLAGLLKGESKISEFLSGKGIAEGPAQEKALELVQDLLKTSLDTKTEESSKAVEALNLEYKKTLEILKSEVNLRELNLQIDKEISGEGGAKLEAERQLLEVSRDINLSDVERANKIEDINKGLDNQLKKLEFQKSSAKDLQGTFAKLFSGIGVEDPSKQANDLFAKINKIASTQATEIGQGLLIGNEKPFESYLNGLGLAKSATDAIKSTLAEWFTNLTLSTTELQKQEGYGADLLGAVRERLALEKTNTDNLAKRNELLQNSIQLNQQLKDLQIKEFTPEEFAKRKQVVELGKPKLNETSLEALKREAQKARLERELQPIDLSRSIQEIQQSSLQTGIGQLTSIATKGAKDATEVAKITEEISKATDLEQLRGQYNGEFNENLDKIIAKRNEEIDQLKEGNTLQEQGLSLAEQKLKAIQSGVFGGLESGLTKLREENEMFSFNLGERIPSLFADNMALAMEGVIMQGEKLSDSLRNAATSFLNEITKANIKNLASNFTTGAAPAGSSIMSSIGTLFKADGGKITGGSGTKDDVPAMLMSGEYVINKKSVSKYGTTFMEALNSGSVSGYAKGGSVIRGRGLGSDVVGNDAAQQTGQGGFEMPGYYGSGDITGKQNLLAFARQAYTSGEGDIIRGGGNFASIDLTPESVRLTNFGRNQGPMAAAVKESKQQALGLYVQQIEAEQRAKEEEDAKKKEFGRALLMAGITAVGSAGLSYAGNVIGTGFQQGMSKTGTFMGGVKGVGEKVGNVGSGLGSLFSGDFKVASQQFKQATQFTGLPKATIVGGTDGVPFGAGGSGRAASVYDNTRASFGGVKLGSTSVFSNRAAASNGNEYQKPDLPVFTPYGIPDEELGGLLPPLIRATGGRIPQTSGIDTVPAMLSGGEFIMNAGATQRIGASNLNAMNSGVTTTTDSSANNEELIRKLDELIKITKESGKPVTVNVSSAQTQSGGEEQSGDSQQKDQNLSRKIKEAVVRVLQEEKRLGGVLRRA